MLITQRLSPRIIIILAGVLLIAAAHAAPAINTLKGGLFGGHGDVAILGYDPVAYFVDSKPEAGLDQYGGYCAYGVAKDNLVSIEPNRWRVLNGKLYLNYDADIQKKWLVDPTGFIKTADGKFSTLLKE
jgi:hypothetical protein